MGGVKIEGVGRGIPSPLGEGAVAVPPPQKNVAFFASKLHVFDAL